MNVYVSCVKRVLDFVIALITLCLLSPFFSLVVVLLFIAHRSFNGIFLCNLEWDIEKRYLKY